MAETVKRPRRTARHIRGFMDFVREQGVVGLAVGLAIGTQASDVVKNLVGSLVTPVLDLIVGPGGLNGMEIAVRMGDHVGNFKIGMLIEALIRFVAVLAIIYVVVKGFHFERLDKKKE